MKRVASIVPFALLAGMASSHAADPEWRSALSGSYLELRGGANFLEDLDADPNASLSGSAGTDPGITAGLALGYSFSDKAQFGAGFWNGARIEAEISYSENDLDTGRNVEQSAIAYMANAYYDFPTGTPITPFVGLGVGAATVELDGVSLRDDADTVFAYQARAGVSYPVSPNVLATFGYRYLATEDAGYRDTGGRSFDAEYEAHAVELGLRYRF